MCICLVWQHCMLPHLDTITVRCTQNLDMLHFWQELLQGLAPSAVSTAHNDHGVSAFYQCLQVTSDLDQHQHEDADHDSSSIEDLMSQLNAL